ncbi:MAG: hypothetical protein WCO77_03415 [bacterium]
MMLISASVTLVLAILSWHFLERREGAWNEGALSGTDQPAGPSLPD